VLLCAVQVASHAKDGDLRSDLLELLERGVAIDRDEGPRSGRERQVAAHDRRPSVGVDLLQAHGPAPAMAQHGSSTGGADVADQLERSPSIETRSRSPW
jgi:hypothetical protein